MSLKEIEGALNSSVLKFNVQFRGEVRALETAKIALESNVALTTENGQLLKWLRMVLGYDRPKYNAHMSPGEFLDESERFVAEIEQAKQYIENRSGVADQLVSEQATRAAE